MYSIIYASFLGEAGVYVSIAHNTVIEQHANHFKECFISILYDAFTSNNCKRASNE